MKNKDVLLFSGGLDSLVAWYYLDKPKCLYVDLGHKYSEREKKAIGNLKELINIDITIDDRLNLGDVEEFDANIPMRNSFLAHIAAIYGERIWLIVQKGETNIPDRSMDFYNDVTYLLRGLNENNEIEVDSPFWKMTKADMVGWYIDDGYPKEVLLASRSCYNDYDKPCGFCPACFRRFVALELNGLKEDYEIILPWETTTAQHYWERAKNEEYCNQRNIEIIEALRKKGW